MAKNLSTGFLITLLTTFSSKISNLQFDGWTIFEWTISSIQEKYFLYEEDIFFLFWCNCYANYELWTWNRWIDPWIMNHIFRPSSPPFLWVFFLILHGCDETLKCARMWKILIFMTMMHYGKIENMEKEVWFIQRYPNQFWKRSERLIDYCDWQNQISKDGIELNSHWSSFHLLCCSC